MYKEGRKGKLAHFSIILFNNNCININIIYY